VHNDIHPEVSGLRNLFLAAASQALTLDQALNPTCETFLPYAHFFIPTSLHHRLDIAMRL